MLSARQELILCKVVDEYLRTDQPVASKTIASDPDLPADRSDDDFVADHVARGAVEAERLSLDGAKR